MRKRTSEYRNIIIPIVGVILIFLVTRLIVYLLHRAFPPMPPSNIVALTGQPNLPGSPFVVNQKTEFACGIDAEVTFATINLEISGGIPPYQVEFDPGEPVVNLHGTGIRFSLPGGSSVSTTLYDSQEKEPNKRKIDIYIPSHSSQCDKQGSILTFTLTPTFTFTPTFTLTTTPTHYLIRTLTSTKHAPDGNGSTNPPPASMTPSPTNINVLATSTNPLPTNTEPKPTSTNPLPTNTELIPTQTQPAPTSTESLPSLVPPSSTPKHPPKQCNDQIDNDKDGKIDLEDLGCQNKNDDNESN